MSSVNSIGARLEAVDLTPLIGSEIKLSVPDLLSGEYAADIRALLDRRGVIVVRRVNLNDEQQIAFSKTLGEVNVQNNKEIMNIALDKNLSDFAEYHKSTVYWHIDMMYWKVPNFASVLTARSISEIGGETEFSNTYAAWDALSDEEKVEYEDLKVMHAVEAAYTMNIPEPTLAQLEEWREAAPRFVQPLVWTHKTGRKSLLIGASAHYVLDKTPEESRYILTKLRDWATQPRFVYRHEWTVGDLLVWDNTGTMHRALPYPADSGRLMCRTVLKGEEATT